MSNDQMTAISAEYKDILEALITANSKLHNIEQHLERLNSKTKTHGECIETIQQWVSAHDAVEKMLQKLEEKESANKSEKIKNNIALYGLFLMAIINIILHFS